MAGFNLDDYVDVPERITHFRERYPEGTLQSEVLELPPAFAESFVAVKAYAYRTPEDPRPGVGIAWEAVPGKTPYTKESELMNAETSAWGRAIVAVGAADTKRGVASKNEVQSRQSQPAAVQQTPEQPPPAEPLPSLMEDTFVCTETDPEGKGRKCIRTTPHAKGHAWEPAA